MCSLRTFNRRPLRAIRAFSDVSIRCADPHNSAKLPDTDLMGRIAPIAWPIAKLLDRALGAEAGNRYKKAELKSFLQFHRQGEEPLRDDEISILNGVLELNTKSVLSIMTPIKVRLKLLKFSKYLTTRL